MSPSLKHVGFTLHEVSSNEHELTRCAVSAIDFVYNPYIIILSRIPTGKVFEGEIRDPVGIGVVYTVANIIGKWRSVNSVDTIRGSACMNNDRQDSLLGPGRTFFVICPRDRNVLTSFSLFFQT